MINSAFVLGFTCFEAILRYPEGGRGMLLIQRPHCILHAFTRSQGTLKVAEGCYEFNARILFYVLSGDPRVP